MPRIPVAEPTVQLTPETKRRIMEEIEISVCVLYIIVIRWLFILYTKYSTEGGVKKPIQHEAQSSAVLSFEIPTRVLY